jgi:glutathione peroxidase
MFSKIEVNGEGASDLYKWLKAEQPGEEESAEVKWNFAKFIVDKEGKAVARFSPMATPEELQVEVAKYL